MTAFKKAYAWINKPQRCAYLFLFPSLILLIVFNIIPLGASFVLSLFDTNSVQVW